MAEFDPPDNLATRVDFALPDAGYFTNRVDRVAAGVPIAAGVLLFEAWALPGLGPTGDLLAPWAAPMWPQGTKPAYLGVLVGLVVLTARRSNTRAHALGLVALGLVTGAAAVRDLGLAVEGFAFRGHPGVAALQARLALLPAVWLALPCALWFRAMRPAAARAPLALGIAALTTLVLTAILLTPIASQLPATSALRVADLISLGALGLATILALTSVVWIARPPGSATTNWAALVVSLPAVAVLAQALMVTHFSDGQWRSALHPTQVASATWAAGLLIPWSLARLFAAPASGP